jgi:mannosyltransferase
MATYASRPAWDMRVRAFTGRLRLAGPTAFVLLVAVSLFIRTRELGIGFWIDEGLSVGISDRPLGAIPHALREDGSPPLYYVLLHFWLGLGGRSESGVRALSLAFALLAIPAAWWAGRAIFRTQRAAWIAAILMAVNPFLSQYAQEARMYSLLALLMIPATACFLRAYALEAESPAARRPWIAGFAVSVAAALYTHNWPIFFTVAAAGAWLVLWWMAPGERRRELVRDGLLGFGGAVVLYLPWVPTTLYQAAHTGAPWSKSPSLAALASVPARLLGVAAEIAVLLVAGAGIVALVQRRGQAARTVICLLAVAVLTLGLAWLASQVSPAWANRYLAAGLPPFLLLAAAGFAAAGRLGIAGLALVAVLWAIDGAPSEKSNVRAVTAAIAPTLRPGDLVVSTQPETVSVLDYYLPPGLRYASLTGTVPDVGVTDWRDGVERLGRTSPERDLKPLLDALPPGRRLALVVPQIYSLGRWSAPWTSLVRERTEEWLAAVQADPRFGRIDVAPEEPFPAGSNAVRAEVFLKR